MIKKSYMQEFLCLCSTLSFTRAAELCYITQPALSRHIAVLEADLGGKLVERTTQSVRITPAGQVVKDAFLEIMKIYNAARDEVEVLSSGKSGMLRISSPYYWTEDFAEPILRIFEPSCPQAAVRVTSCQPEEGMRQVADGQADFAINSYDVTYEENMIRLPYASEPYAIVMEKENPLAHRQTLALEEIKDMPLVLYNSGSENIDALNALVLSLLAKRGAYPGKIFYTQQIDTLGMAIQEHHAVSFQPYCVRHMDRSYLRTVPLTDEDCRYEICLYYRNDNNNPLIPLFVQKTGQAFEQVAYRENKDQRLSDNI